MIYKRWQYWTGVLLGIIFISSGTFPLTFPLMLLGGFITGFIVGSGMEGAKAGFFAGIIGIIIRTKGSIILNPASAILDLVLIIVIPVVICGVIGGWTRQLVNKQAECVNYRTKES
jgi:hypothetical protein